MLLRKELMPNQKVFSLHRTLDSVIKGDKIFIRLGDGELPILNQKNGGLHTYDENLRNKLLESYYYALASNDFLLGVNPNLIYPFTNPSDASLISSCKHYHLMDFLSFFPLQDYANALTLRISPLDLYHEKYPIDDYWLLLHQASYNLNFYNENKIGIQAFSYYRNHFIEPIKLLWKDKNVIVCEGKFSFFGVYNDLFEYAKSVQRVQGENHNAFADYENLLNQALQQAKQYPQDEVYFVCALGHTSKILLTDLHKLGFKKGIDAGNLSITYDSIIHNFPSSWADDPIQMLNYPPLYYGKQLKQWEKRTI